MNGLLFHTVLGILPFFREYKKCVCVGNILLNYNVSFSFMVFLMIYRNIEINIPNYVQHLCLILSYPRFFVNMSIIANAQIQCLNFATQKGSLKIAWASQKKKLQALSYILPP